MAEAFAIKERRAFDILKAGDKLLAEEVELLEQSGARMPMEDLIVLAKIGDPEERAHVVQALAGGKVKAAAARRAWKAGKNGVQSTHKNRVEGGYEALVKAWKNAPKAAKRRFVETRRSELESLLASDGDSDA